MVLWVIVEFEFVGKWEVWVVFFYVVDEDLFYLVYVFEVVDNCAFDVVDDCVVFGFDLFYCGEEVLVEFWVVDF